MRCAGEGHLAATGRSAIERLEDEKRYIDMTPVSDASTAAYVKARTDVCSGFRKRHRNLFEDPGRKSPRLRYSNTIWKLIAASVPVFEP